jgi:hypothetical protein
MHVMDDSLTYIEDISKKFDGNLDAFMKKTGVSISKSKMKHEFEEKFDPLR